MDGLGVQVGCVFRLRASINGSRTGTPPCGASNRGTERSRHESPRVLSPNGTISSAPARIDGNWGEAGAKVVCRRSAAPTAATVGAAAAVPRGQASGAKVSDAPTATTSRVPTALAIATLTINI